MNFIKRQTRITLQWSLYVPSTVYSIFYIGLAGGWNILSSADMGKMLVNFISVCLSVENTLS